MRSINRQVIGFVVGAIFLVIVILIFAYFLSAIGSAQIRYNNIQYLHWFEGGVVSAWSKGDWADTEAHKLESDGANNYYVMLIPNYTAKIINDSFSGDDRNRISDSLSTCIAPNSLCMCLIEFKSFPGLNFQGLIFLKSDSSLEDWNKTVISYMNSAKDSFTVVECENMILKGFSYEDENGDVHFPKLMYNKSYQNQHYQIVGIASDYSSGFEMHKWKHQVNITEATS